jgi:aspartate racemase
MLSLTNGKPNQVILPEAYLGILGGMGPLATADFLMKLVMATHATTDQAHIPVLLRSVPQIPDRSAAILGNGPSPLPSLIKGVEALCKAGATAIAIPCNTAHYWYKDMAEASMVPILHIVDSVFYHLNTMACGGSVGLLATKGTIAARVYNERFTNQGSVNVLVPTDDEIERFSGPGIDAVKAGDLAGGRSLLKEAAERLRDRGANAIVMGCTEIPIVLTENSCIGIPLIDATACLADSCASWWERQRGCEAVY